MDVFLRRIGHGGVGGGRNVLSSVVHRKCLSPRSLENTRYCSPELLRTKYFVRHLPYSAVNATFNVTIFDKHGDFREQEFTKAGLLKDTGLNARDLIVLDSGFHRRPRPTILVRGSGIIVCMSYIRAIVQQENVFLFHPQDLDVKYFTSRFSAYLKGKRPPFLPTVFLGNSNPSTQKVPVAQKTQEFIQDESAQQLPFECKALEGILSHVCRQYYNHTLLVSPLVKNLLQELSSRKVDPATLHKLLPVKDVLSKFEIETTLMRNVLNDVLQNDDDMLAMLLTERAKYGDEIPLEKHEMVELLLENYCSQMVDISQEAYYLRKQIESTQSIIELKLDTYRNHMLRINMQLAISSIAIACSTAVAGIFGMNLSKSVWTGLSFEVTVKLFSFRYGDPPTDVLLGRCWLRCWRFRSYYITQ